MDGIRQITAVKMTTTNTRNTILVLIELKKPTRSLFLIRSSINCLNSSFVSFFMEYPSGFIMYVISILNILAYCTTNRCKIKDIL